MLDFTCTQCKRVVPPKNEQGTGPLDLEQRANAMLQQGLAAARQAVSSAHARPVQQSCLIVHCRLSSHVRCHSVLRLSLQLADMRPLMHGLCTSSQCLRCRALQPPALSMRSCSHPLAARAGFIPATLCCMTGLCPRLSLPASLVCDDASAMLMAAAVVCCSLLPHTTRCRLNLIAFTEKFYRVRLTPAWWPLVA